MAEIDVFSFHRKLLNAPERMTVYQQAIHQAVKPGDTVIDLGCGSGILGLYACQAGARRVYAIEKSPAISIAKELAIANGYSDRIIHIAKDIKDVEIDESVDVIVSELVSKAVIGQRMSESIGYCRDNFLHSNGRIVPEEVTLFVAPVHTPETYAKTNLPSHDTYRIDFSALNYRSVTTPISCKLHNDDLLCSPQSAYVYDAYRSGLDDYFNSTIEFRHCQPKQLHGFVLWFSMRLFGSISLSNQPPGIPAWDNLFLPLADPIEIETSDTIRLNICGRDDSRMNFLWIWNTEVRKQNNITSQKQSNFHL